MRAGLAGGRSVVEGRGMEGAGACRRVAGLFLSSKGPDAVVKGNGPGDVPVLPPTSPVMTKNQEPAPLLTWEGDSG